MLTIIFSHTQIWQELENMNFDNVLRAFKDYLVDQKWLEKANQIKTKFKINIF